MAAAPEDVAPPLVVVESQKRSEFIKCATPWCRNNLGVRQPGGVVWWKVPVQQDYRSGQTQIECPDCGTKRTWSPGRAFRSLRPLT